MPDPNPFTVGHIRRLIADLPDDAPVFPKWADGPPSDSEPAVCIDGFRVARCHTEPGEPKGFAILVSLEYLDEMEDDFQ